MPANYKELATGKYYEELNVGNVYRHAITRTVCEADNLLFSALTYNSAWLHTDEEYSRSVGHPGRLVNSLFTLSLACGVTVADTTLGTTTGNLGFFDVKFLTPVYIGDTLRSETEIISKRESKSRPNSGIVEFETRSYNQRDEVVLTFRRTGMMLKKNPPQA
ncbi:MaoC family dehydratase [Ruixingdingia sedimenti]|uniref:MaoC family dehydratase n=1 Tax=Ruixingdingia sedimenti TaxID=3073604 RepID=A0ABU1F8V5_9RHOB|nr:MaoC family dehydratase [Xinfangfangia sp. LG-4]MDR5653314.1 MaoC family dehydratase [Xinfangfangia sp. LG-4]